MFFGVDVQSSSDCACCLSPQRRPSLAQRRTAPDTRFRLRGFEGGDQRWRPGATVRSTQVAPPVRSKRLGSASPCDADQSDQLDSIACPAPEGRLGASPYG